MDMINENNPETFAAINDDYKLSIKEYITSSAVDTNDNLTIHDVILHLCFGYFYFPLMLLGMYVGAYKQHTKKSLAILLSASALNAGAMLVLIGIYI
jgi:hypothetical protein